MRSPRKPVIVVGVDDSTFSGQALRWAAEQAHLESMPLVLVHATKPAPTVWPEPSMANPHATYGTFREYSPWLLARAEQVVHQAAPDVEVRHRVAISDARQLLVEQSASAAMVVLGSRGRGAALSHLLGSVGLGVASRASCPVVVHRPGHPGRVLDGVLVAADATEASRPVLELGFRQASLRGLPLRVLHYMYDARSALVGAPMVGDLADEQVEEELALAESMAGLREDHPEVRVVVDVVRGLPAADLVRAGTRADLLVVGNHQRGAVSRLLAPSVANTVLEHATCPVALVPLGRL
jgi:nucleotide-binding universal stress UspA family protein